tara:strand:+ start:1863 stop:2249 length:387 start_codon:yes stop_codon:yes gene_type:complete
MFDFYQKRKLRAIVHSPYARGLILLLAIWVGWSAYVRYEIAVEMKERRVAAEQEATALEERKAALEETVEYLSNERGIEAEMRRQFDVSLPGEQVVVIVEDENDDLVVEPLSTSTQNVGKKKWYQFWR